MTSLITDKARWSEDSDGIWLSIRVKDRRAAIRAATEITKPHAVDIKQYRERRSLDANAYFWVLLDKLAAVIQKAKTEIYREYIKDIGGNSETVCVLDSAVDKLRDGWHHNGLGWQTDTTPSKIAGCTNVVLYYGSSTYDTAQMSRLINLVVQDCKDQGIEVLGERELSLMTEGWMGGHE